MYNLHNRQTLDLGKKNDLIFYILQLQRDPKINTIARFGDQML